MLLPGPCAHPRRRLRPDPRRELRHQGREQLRHLLLRHVAAAVQQHQLAAGQHARQALAVAGGHQPGEQEGAASEARGEGCGGVTGRQMVLREATSRAERLVGEQQSVSSEVWRQCGGTAGREQAAVSNRRTGEGEESGVA